MESTATRELNVKSVFDVPMNTMWELWTTPGQIVNWWGPDGFTTTVHAMECWEGGEWRLTLHGPDGTNYPNRSIYREIIPGKKIVFEHFNPHFFTTVLFELVDKGTQVDWTMLFDTTEMLEIVVKAHKADEGLKQNLNRLGHYISKLISETK